MPPSPAEKPMQLPDKVVVITGSTRGIGRAVAGACAREGASVVVCSRTGEAVAETVQAIRAQGRRASGVVADVSRPDDVEALVRHAIEEWGRVDVWINNAGVSGGMRPLDHVPVEDIRRLVDINLYGTLLACRAVIPLFVRQRGGVLLNISGRGGRGEPAAYLATYAATKAAVTSLTRSLAREFRHEPISIHAVLPGMVATDFFRDVEVGSSLEGAASSLPWVLKALGMSPEEVAAGVVRIASQVPGRATGKVYSLMGRGRLLRGIARLAWYRATGRIRVKM